MRPLASGETPLELVWYLIISCKIFYEKPPQKPVPLLARGGTLVELVWCLNPCEVKYSMKNLRNSTTLGTRAAKNRYEMLASGETVEELVWCFPQTVSVGAHPRPGG